jgi:subtilase family serine protease
MSVTIRSIPSPVVLASLTAALVALGGPPAARADALAHRDAQDIGATPAAQLVSSSLILKVKHPELLERFVALTQEPGLPTFHRFLSVREFAALFAPSPGEIATITRYLNSFGITVTDVLADRLVIHASGTVDAFQRAFTVDMHEFVTPQGQRFRRPMHGPQIPVLLRDLVIAVGGFSTEPMFHPNVRSAAALAPAIAPPPVVLPQPGATATGRPGSFTVGDFATQYNVNPLYAAGLDGRGRTVGVVTLANFLPADALAYWNMIGLRVDPDRITQVHVDGGGLLSTAADSIETALDVEQAGGVAPGAKVVVYDAPNDDQGFIDLFYQAASDNLVDSLSCSWGLAEPFFFEALRGTDVTAEFAAFHQAFLEAAAQGISVFVASLDNGAYDINQSGFNASFSNTLSVDHPSDDPAVTAAGGTTLPVVLTAGPGTPDLVVPTEQVWAWDYIENYLVALFGDVSLHAEFPFGTGGGVSVVFDVPWYQKRTPGIRTSEPNQSVVLFPQSPTPQHLLDLPAGFAGRNVPDISANADPETGYLVVSSIDGGLISGFGGTSFVAPQLNGVSALISQQVGTRLGLWNPMLYRYQRDLMGSASSPIVDITGGTNWFYAGVPGYEPGAGLGVLNVANLAAAIARDAR